MITLALASEEAANPLLKKMGIEAPDMLCFVAKENEQALAALAFCFKKGQAVLLCLWEENGMGGSLTDGLIRAVLNYASRNSAPVARFDANFPKEALRKLPAFSSLGIAPFDIEVFFASGKNCGE